MLASIIIGSIVAAILFLLVGFWIGIDNDDWPMPTFLFFMASFILFLTVATAVQYGRETSTFNVCPVCNETYDRDMKYCSADGTELVLSIE